MPDPSNGNESVFSPPTLVLGEVHWHLLRASQLMYENTVVKTKGTGFVVHEGYTEFGREVGRDEINWWVFKKERNIEELREQTSRALDAAQKLKKDSETLTTKNPETHAALLATLRQFADDHAAEIETVRRYVLWLAARDALAPSILWTYRVWGSTRRGDRDFELNPEEAEPKLETIKNLTEIVLGLTWGRLPVMVRAEIEIGGEIYEHMCYDEESANAGIQIPMRRIVQRASAKAFHECAEYFEQIRDSLRNVLLDVEKFVEQRNLVSDDAFWRDFIVKAARTPKAETQLWDLKETLTMWHVEKNPERDQAKVTFCEAVASFANARGGVLVIGVTDKREIVGIGNGRELENKLKFAADVLAKHIEYPREIVRLRQAVMARKDGTDRVCLVVVIAQACEPAGVNDGSGRYTYPVRRETGLMRVPRDEVLNPKIHMKSDNHEFLRELYQFLHEK
jgi:Putative DNA-binding domain